MTIANEIDASVHLPGFSRRSFRSSRSNFELDGGMVKGAADAAALFLRPLLDGSCWPPGRILVAPTNEARELGRARTHEASALPS